MPIYAYKCESCGHSKDVLQKMSGAPLTDCPQCGAATFKKQLTAAGFQLKGSGWYVTDFRGGPTNVPPAGQGSDAAPTAGSAKPAAAAAAASSSPAPAAASTAAPAPSPSPAPASSGSASTKGSV